MPRLCYFASFLSLALLTPPSAWAADAPVVADNPEGAKYVAQFSQSGLIANAVAQTPPSHQGVAFSISIAGNATLDSANYLYHIHDQPVPEDGNCTSTLAHLDPYGRGETPPCDANDPASCQVGDLSGKHGTIPKLPGFSAAYTDSYISLTPGTAAFMGNRSLVIHFPNKTRIACGNFQRVDGNSYTGNSTTGSWSTSSLGYKTTTSTYTKPFPTATSIVSSYTTHPSGSSVPLSNAAKKSTPHNHGAVLGSLILGIAVAVW